MVASSRPAKESGPLSSSLPGQRDEQLTSAKAAASAGHWEAARTAFAALAAADPSPAGEILEGLARSLKMADAFLESCNEMERAYRAFVKSSDHLGAARAARFLYSMHEKLAQRAAARGWEQRALRHLEKIGRCVELGYLAVALTGCEIHDPRELRERSELALTIAREFSDHDLELRALGDKGLSLVCQGYVDEGFALLDEVMVVAIQAGEVSDGEVRAMTVRALLTACERIGDRGRAEYWCRAVEEDPRLREIGIVITQCAIVYGSVEALLGRWESAERRFRQAAQAHSTTIYHQSDAIARLAELQLQQGRYEEAAETLLGYEEEFEVTPVLARLRIAEGNYPEASRLLRDTARGLGGDAIRLGPTLALLVDVELRRNDLAAATRAARRLKSLEDDCGSNEVRAMARLAQARIALDREEPEAAIDDLETAMTLLTHRDRPLLAAQVRLELARALTLAGERESARVEAEAALATFVRLGVAPDIAASQELVERLGRPPVNPGQGTPATTHLLAGEVATLTRREDEVARLVARGLANQAIADHLHLSIRTVESHVDRILGKLDFHNRTQLAAWVRLETTS